MGKRSLVANRKRRSSKRRRARQRKELTHSITPDLYTERVGFSSSREGCPVLPCTSTLEYPVDHGTPACDTGIFLPAPSSNISLWEADSPSIVEDIEMSSAAGTAAELIELDAIKKAVEIEP